jgi:hypothetical protein
MAFPDPDSTNGGELYYDFASGRIDYVRPDAALLVPAELPPGLDGVAKTAQQPGGQPATLTFYSWWSEDAESSDITFRVSSNSEVGGGLRRRYCTVAFDLASNTFAVRTVDADGPDSQSVIAVGNVHATSSRTSTGAPLSAWDLHVGTTVYVLGRRISLLKADLATSQWIDQHGRCLLALKQELVDEVLKYKPRSLPACLIGTRGSPAKPGTLALRPMVGQVQALIAELHQHRPSKGAGRLRTFLRSLVVHV